MKYRLSPGNGPRPTSLEPCDDDAEDRCPECGSDEVSQCHAEATFALPETDWLQCDRCQHAWNHQ